MLDKNAFRVAMDFRMPHFFLSQLVEHAALGGSPDHEAFRHVCIETIHNEAPFSAGVRVHGSRDVLHELGFGAGRFQRGRGDFSTDHVQTRRQRRRAMTCVFKLLLGHLAGLNGLVGSISFEGLQRGRLVHAHRMSSVDRGLLGSVPIGLADIFHLALELFGILLRGVEPHLFAVRLQRGSLQEAPHLRSRNRRHDVLLEHFVVQFRDRPVVVGTPR